MSQQRIVKALERKNGQTNKELAKKLKINTDSVGKNCRRMRKYGELLIKPVKIGCNWESRNFLVGGVVTN